MAAPHPEPYVKSTAMSDPTSVGLADATDPSDAITDLLSDGFTVGDNYAVNELDATYDAWGFVQYSGDVEVVPETVAFTYPIRGVQPVATKFAATYSSGGGVIPASPRFIGVFRL